MLVDKLAMTSSQTRPSTVVMLRNVRDAKAFPSGRRNGSEFTVRSRSVDLPIGNSDRAIETFVQNSLWVRC